MGRAKESTLKVFAMISFPTTTGFQSLWPHGHQVIEQERHTVSVEGDFATGDELADAVFAKMPAASEWCALLVQVQIVVDGQASRAKDVTGAFGLRSGIRLEFDGIKRRSANQSPVEVS
jgi:hypothetical protein